MKSKILFISFISLCLFSFNTDSVEGADLFMEFDQAVHLRYEISAEDAQRYLSPEETDKKDFPSWVFESLPNDLNKKLEKQMVKAGCKSITIPIEKHDELKEIMAVKSTSDFELSQCKPVYRDFIILKKKKRPVGIVQICFTCSQIQFVGNLHNTGYFGQSGEFEKLQALLN